MYVLTVNTEINLEVQHKIEPSPRIISKKIWRVY